MSFFSSYLSLSVDNFDVDHGIILLSYAQYNIGKFVFVFVFALGSGSGTEKRSYTSKKIIMTIGDFVNVFLPSFTHCSGTSV